LDKLQKKFAQHFKEQLKKRYKKIPSTNFIANEFNLRAHDSATVSREAVRKWLNGLSLPKSDKLSVMRKWLDIQTDLFDKE
jgi:CRISPR/Cas system endoribonuclease Cas6 (RAMP superfamily)